MSTVSVGVRYVLRKRRADGGWIVYRTTCRGDADRWAEILGVRITVER